MEIGAVDNDARLTALGKHLVSGQNYKTLVQNIELWSIKSLLPLDVRLAKVGLRFFICGTRNDNDFHRCLF